MHRFKPSRPTRRRAPLDWLCAALVVLLPALPAVAVDIQGTQSISFDLPRVYGVFQPAGGGTPYATEDFLGNPTFTIEGFLDTGSSGIVIDPRIRTLFDLPTTAGTVFSDIAIGGGTDFNVSVPLDLRIAPSTALDLDRPSTLTTVYNQSYPSTRVQVGPINILPDPFSEPLNIYGMPAMIGKTVVMDPRPLNDLSDLMHTTIYDRVLQPNAPIPDTSHHVKLSYGDFRRFTETTPIGAAPPSISHNPFIGPNPVDQLLASPLVDDTPPVRIAFQGAQTTGSFLLDTGAVTSFISSKLAENLNVRYVAGTFGTDEPLLEFLDGTPVPRQFVFPIQGIGGAALLAGFFLDQMVLETIEGGAGDHPNNIRYVQTPVLIVDIELFDPASEEMVTLDGVFGMNNLMASAFLTPDLNITDTAIGPYNWLVFDEPSGVLGLDLGIQVPEPGSNVLAACGALVLAGYAWRCRRVPQRSAICLPCVPLLARPAVSIGRTAYWARLDKPTVAP